jgi:putative ABC transport system substrate-binding protein
MKRRDALGILALAPALASRAWAQPAVRRIAWFGAGRPGAASPFLDAVRAGLLEKGWEEGRSLEIAQFLTEGTPKDAAFIARQIIAANPELIIVYGRDVLTLYGAKPPQPVVFAFSGNPVDGKVVESFARPGANFTGISFMSLELVGKRIEVLRELVPQIRRLAVLARPEHPGEHRERAASEAVAAKLGMVVSYVPIEEASGIDGALQAVARAKCDALVVFPDGVMLGHSQKIAKFALDAKLPVISGWDRFADNGFLATYGPNLRDSYRRIGHYADRILRGTKPSDIPVELPQTVEMVVNLRTAQALGLRIPPTILLRADRVIE